MNLPGGGKAIFAFSLSLFAYTLQTEFAQYVQQALNYRKPFLSLYLGHSGFLLLFPMHLFFLSGPPSAPSRTTSISSHRICDGSSTRRRPLYRTRGPMRCAADSAARPAGVVKPSAMPTMPSRVA